VIKQAIKSISGAAVASGPGTGGKAREIGADGSLQLFALQKIHAGFSVYEWDSALLQEYWGVHEHQAIRLHRYERR